MSNKRKDLFKGDTFYLNEILIYKFGFISSNTILKFFFFYNECVPMTCLTFNLGIR